MKLKLTLFAAAFTLAAATAAQAGPNISISVGANINRGNAGYCAPRPVYYCQPVYYQRPVVVYRPAPVYWGGPRYRNVGYGNCGPNVYRVPPPVQVWRY